MNAILVCLLIVAPHLAVRGADHVIFIQNEQVEVHCPATWIIIAHKPVGTPSDIVAFQILNPADDGTEDSTNLSVVAFDIRDTGAMLKFTKSVLDHEKLKHASKEHGAWAVNTWSDKQGSTDYEIRDCYQTVGAFGIHVRLACPKLPKTTKAWTEKLEADFFKVLDGIKVKESK